MIIYVLKSNFLKFIMIEKKAIYPFMHIFLNYESKMSIRHKELSVWGRKEWEISKEIF